MGLLTIGTPLTWEETKKYIEHVKENGIIQFINIYRKVKDRKNDQLFWGDELEYTLVYFSKEDERVFVLLKASEVLDKVRKFQTSESKTVWQEEYAAYAIEGVPGRPYGHLMGHFNTVEANMQLRRREISDKYLSTGEAVLTIVAFPRTLTQNIRERRGKKVAINIPSK